MTWTGAARRRDQNIGNIAWDGGSGSPKALDLRNVGYLERLRLQHTLNGVYATAGPTGGDPFAAYAGAIDRITVSANSVANLFDCSGFMTAVISAIDAQYRYGSATVNPTPPGVFTATPGTAAFGDVWTYEIPIALDLANKPYPYGLFQTALNAQEVRAEIRFKPVVATGGTPGSGVYVGNGANLQAGTTGNVAIQQVYYDPIPDAASQPTLAFVHSWRDFQVPLTADGDTEIRLPPSNYYLRIIYAIVTGGAGALALDNLHLTRLRLQYGANLAPYDEPFQALFARMQRQYDVALPAGVYVHDFIEESHTERDAVNSAATTDLRAVLTMAGATYSGGAYVRVAVEQLTPLNVPAPGSAVVQGVA